MISSLLHRWREIKHSTISVLCNLLWFSLELNISFYFILLILNFKISNKDTVYSRELQQLSVNKCKESIIYKTIESPSCKPEQIEYCNSHTSIKILKLKQTHQYNRIWMWRSMKDVTLRKTVRQKLGGNTKFQPFLDTSYSVFFRSFMIEFYKF